PLKAKTTHASILLTFGELHNLSFGDYFVDGAAKKNETPPPTTVPAPFSSSVAIVRASEPKTRIDGVSPYERLPDSSLRSRSPRGTSGVSARRQERLNPPETAVRSVRTTPTPAPVNHAPRVKYPVAP